MTLSNAFISCHNERGQTDNAHAAIKSSRNLEEELSPADARKYLGGRCRGVKILLRELQGGPDPLGPDNRLTFLTGSLNAPPFPGCVKHCLTAKSLETHATGESMSGGFFGPFLNS